MTKLTAETITPKHIMDIGLEAEEHASCSYSGVPERPVVIHFDDPKWKEQWDAASAAMEFSSIDDLRLATWTRCAEIWNLSHEAGQ